MSVHDHSDLSEAEKLMYLQQAIKDGSTKSVIEGLSRSGDQYQEAIIFLKSRYNHPRVTHHAHVRMVVDAPPLKDGSGKELRRLHDTLQQHFRALKSEPDSFFIISIIELKLDQDTMCEWSKHSQDKTKEVPHYQDILDFLDLRAQVSESSLPTIPKRHAKVDPPPSKRPSGSGKHVAAFPANSDPGNSHCVLCISECHPLYVRRHRKGDLWQKNQILSFLAFSEVCDVEQLPGGF